MNRINCMGMSKDMFREWVIACCDTFVRDIDKLYSLYENGNYSTYIDITFPLRVNEVATMEINVNKIVRNEEEKVVVIKSLDKESKENENKNGNER